MPDKPGESNSQQHIAGRSSPAVKNASPTSGKFNNRGGPPVSRKDMSSNGNNSLVTKGNIFTSKED